jgi:hypothetical protein
MGILVERLKSVSAVALIACGVGGCAASAGISYAEYRSSTVGGTGRLYESSIQGDTQRGFAAETCKTVISRRANGFGENTLAEETVCEETGPRVP